MEEENNYKPYDYSHYSLGSKPAITTEKFDTEIAHVLNLLNEHPDVTKEQLIHLENVIKQKIQEKEDKYLIPSRNTQTTTARRIQFAEGTKYGGKRRKTRKNYKRKKGGMETAENVYIPKVKDVILPNNPSLIPKSFQNPKNPVINVHEDNIYENVTQGTEAPIEAEVLATTGKSRDPFTRAYHKIGKIVGTRPKTTTLKSLDYDLTIFNNTCLKDVPLTTEEISIFKSISDKKLIRTKLNLYCDVRRKLFEKDIHFDTKYPKIFEQMLRLVLTSNDTIVNEELRGVLFRHDVELEDYNEDIVLPESEYIAHVEATLPRDYLYDKPFTKRGGKKRVNKNKRTKRSYKK